MSYGSGEMGREDRVVSGMKEERDDWGVEMWATASLFWIGYMVLLVQRMIRRGEV